MGFREHLEEMVHSVDGAVAASVMGFDGIAIDTVDVSANGTGDVDIQTMLVEYTNILSQLRQAAEVLESGKVTELSIGTEKLTTLARALTDEYFAVLAVAPEANLGKARYVLRINAPKIKAEL